MKFVSKKLYMKKCNVICVRMTVQYLGADMVHVLDSGGTLLRNKNIWSIVVDGRPSLVVGNYQIPT